MKGKERAELRAEAHHLDPTVHVGQHGLTPALITSLEDALKSFSVLIDLYPKRRDSSSYAPYGNLVGGIDGERLQKVRRFATAEPRLQSFWSELDDIRIGSCRAGYHVVDATIR